MNKYDLPLFLQNVVTVDRYRKWLHGKAKSHCKRDCVRGNTSAQTSIYKQAIHTAVIASNGLDDYTGDALDWHLIGTYNNEESKKTRRVGKAALARLPTVDHVGDGLGEPTFRICGWAVNDAKNDLNFDQFLDLCRRVIEHHERSTLPALKRTAL